jgi:DNA polymerase-1
MKVDRHKGKGINLGIPYGLTRVGLAASLDLSKSEAQDLLDGYFDNFPGVATYIARQRSWARSMEYVTTLGGRVAWINNHSFQAERNATNSPIQGTGADMLKRAMVLLREECQARGWDLPIVNDSYDEIVVEMPKGLLRSKGAKVLRNCMLEAAHELCPDVPFEVDGAAGYTWAVGKEEEGRAFQF